MVNKKISQLDNGGNIQNTDDIPIVRGGANFKAQIANRQLLIASPTNDNVVTTDTDGQVKDSGVSISEVAILPLDLAGSDVTGTLPNNKTTASSSNTVNAIVTRDSSGNFSAGTITAALNGNASSATFANTANTATSATTATNISGGTAGSIPYQTSAGSTTLLAAGTGVLVGGTNPSYTNAPTLVGTNFSGIPNSATTATSSNTNNAIVARDGSGNFSAGTITANLSGIASFASSLNGGAAGTIPYQNSVSSTSMLSPVTNGILVGGSTPSYVINTNAQSRFLFQANSGAPGFTALTTSNLTDYLDANWTPVDASGGVTITVQAARYISIGALVTCWAKITYPSTADASNASISGLPFTIANAVYNEASVSVLSSTTLAAKGGKGTPNTTTFTLTDSNGGAVTNANCRGATLWLRIVYKK